MQFCSLTVPAKLCSHHRPRKTTHTERKVKLEQHPSAVRLGDRPMSGCAPTSCCIGHVRRHNGTAYGHSCLPATSKKVAYAHLLELREASVIDFVHLTSIAKKKSNNSIVWCSPALHMTRLLNYRTSHRACARCSLNPCKQLSLGNAGSQSRICQLGKRLEQVFCDLVLGQWKGGGDYDRGW